MNKSILATVCFALLLGACHQESQEMAAPRPVWVMTVGASDLQVGGSYTGEVRSRYESNIGFRIAGKITAREANVGDQVKKGQLIARLDPNDTRLNAQAANAEVQTAQANLALALAELERRQQLYRQQFISRSALDSYDTQVKTAQARVAQAQSQAAVSQHQTAYTQLLADRAGVIGMIQAEPGQVVAAGQTIAQIYDLQSLEILISVPETMIDVLQVGDPAQVTLTESSQAYAGRIREISPAANSQTHAFDLRIQLLKFDQRIKLGMTAQVSFAHTNPAQTIIVPATAVTQNGNQPAVWVIDKNHQAHMRPVTTGTLTEAGIEITAGLHAQETIATIGVHTLTEGMKVYPVTPGPEVLR
ncbi:RND family efflux transporter, MFP subunit [Methylophilus rhizosphaerae]|uniref:RND family efflux transporter, MFP subunit n=1 Tax=Methylophilus rhizosphaerae TaxID=492660 RepID=A0A1G9CDQ7_9PROT|nr:efflux RND transporter periplasmic adaptor subunit [Methylophilus rhizosphaerae]SDK49594.1 RND family efflux transporter, MFP subunit [Methylophilus rhizosphaerae]